ncbi:hypothetical protein Ae168Ps1_3950c [Pseudonocardia sp. Ae168_Ps1]|nr:hypothetical protein Ae150APs1_3927c [Pseudonocardia sp. Ae150A_Ps1]OLL81544.1 hypothetical protein Ae168Ps1_3950c [Pseudonocardia sp. Ae168_Ps1]OLL84343.1 hypothetical protein Ae263Ps1_1398 [Pseudonocardia sp. Ae263_Ps1]OLL95639.1 hypothetical protein Ae356Ps1_5536c [Pseudonocardia sp. Ae356_Ps1]
MSAVSRARPARPAGDESHVTARLAAEFAADLDHRTVVAVVRTCRRRLAGVPPGSLPELLERLAREELHDVVGADRHPAR